MYEEDQEEHKNLDRFARWLAWKLPKRLVMWCAIRLIANATQGIFSDQIVPDLTAMDALDRWEMDSNWTGSRMTLK